MKLGEIIKQLQKLELKYGSNITIISSYGDGYLDEINEVTPGFMYNDEFDETYFEDENIKNSDVNSIYIG